MHIDNYFNSSIYVIIKHEDIVNIKYNGSTYVVLNRVIKCPNLGIKDIEGISKNRIYIKIHMHPKIEKCLIEEERLYKVEQHTLKYFK